MGRFCGSVFECGEGDYVFLVPDDPGSGCRRVGEYLVWVEPGGEIELWFEKRVITWAGGLSILAWVRVK